MQRRGVAVVAAGVAGFLAWAVWTVVVGVSAPKAGSGAEAPGAGAAGGVEPPGESTGPAGPRRRGTPDRGRVARAAVPPPEPAPVPRARPPAGWMDEALVDPAGRSSMELAEDLDAFRDHFETEAPGPTVDGTDAQAVTHASDGATILFPAGAHVWDTRGLNARDRWPHHVTVKGAGIDATLVRLSEEIISRGELTALTLRDLTVHCSDDGLTDLRSGKPASIRLDRCRVIGFDAGHGGCDLFNGDVGAFLAEDSRIEMGFGRSPGWTEFFDVRGGRCAVRLERCVIVGPVVHTMFFTNATQGFVLVGCELRDMRPGHRSQIESNSSVRLRDCRITYLADPDSGRRPTRNVSELNPEWTLPPIPGK